MLFDMPYMISNQSSTVADYSRDFILHRFREIVAYFPKYNTLHDRDHAQLRDSLSIQC